MDIYQNTLTMETYMFKQILNLQSFSLFYLFLYYVCFNTKS